MSCRSRRDGDKVIPLTDAGVAVSYFRDMNGNGAIDREDEGTLTPLGGNGFYDGVDDLSGADGNTRRKIRQGEE